MSLVRQPIRAFHAGCNTMGNSHKQAGNEGAMNLNGLDYFKTYSDSDWDFTLKVENSSNEVLRLISLYGDQPNSSALAAAHALLVEIEKWKAMCLKERMGNAEQNSRQAVWSAFRGALDASNDLDAILSIMQLRGFGSSRDEESRSAHTKSYSCRLRLRRMSRD
jgi:hypothetical protein